MLRLVGSFVFFLRRCCGIFERLGLASKTADATSVITAEEATLEEITEEGPALRGEG
jgi:hypothetical protein